LLHHARENRDSDSDLNTCITGRLPIINNNKNGLKFLSLNVCGLKSKLILPEFCSYIEQFDIIGFQETKLDSLDTVSLNNFDLHFKHRKQFSRRKSGGIAVAIKTHLSKYITIIENDCNMVLWFTLDRNLTQGESVLYGVVYVPPENSEFSVNDPFYDIQNDINRLSNNYSGICLFGDWNCRTKTLSDVVDVDYSLFHENGLDDLFLELQETQNRFNENVRLLRKNADKNCNNYGYKFVDFLQLNDLYMLNGRTVGDLEGQTTCKGLSTVDYFICSPNLLLS
jgi:exonuclease III